MPNQNLFDVHLFAIVRWKLPAVPAVCPETAIQAAREHPATARWLRLLEDPQGIGEFADEFSHYLVDVTGDEEFEQSRWFHAAESPLVVFARRWVEWADNGRAVDELPQLHEEARQILSQSI